MKLMYQPSKIHTKFWWIVIIGIIVLTTIQSCIKEPPTPVHNNNPGNVEGLRVVVLCEGNYLWNNASLDLFLPDSQKVYNNVFEGANATNLGDVLQSALYHNGKLNLVVNNSGKITQVHPKTFKITQSKSGFSSPRYMILAGDKFIVSDIKSAYLTVLDTQTLEKVGEILIPEQFKAGETYWTEKMTVVDSFVYVAVELGKLLVVNLKTNSREWINVSPGSTQICSDAQKRVWLLCSQNGKAELYQFNGNTREKEQHVAVFPQLSNVNAIRMALSSSQNELHFLVNGRLATLTNLNQIQSQNMRFIEILGLNNAYALQVNPHNGDIYIGDARDYVSNGRVFVLDSAAKQKYEFQTGIIPTDFVFIKD
jgi:hypothetical protein